MLWLVADKEDKRDISVYCGFGKSTRAFERSSRDGSRLRRQWTLSVPVPPTSQAIPPPPTSQRLPPAPTLQALPLPPTLLQINPQASTSSVVGPSAPSWGRGTGRRGLTRGVIERRLPDGQQWNVSVAEDMAWALLQITLRVAWALYQKCIHFNGKSLDDAIASVPAGVDSLEWQIMCEMWTTVDERSQMHGRTAHRLEVFKMGRCKDLPDGNESWRLESSCQRDICPRLVHADKNITYGHGFCKR
ncbi:hypothetical protein Taro_036544 [Colocasia esculenta]|uniref:Uncharacterized protein n=1 Tax=Colocasia esculenta TaxID=4460 RepID=A0A843WGL7_COLES|nr:hypothetical protein [Colocasia esculenta]